MVPEMTWLLGPFPCCLFLKWSICARESGISDINICMGDPGKTGLSGTTTVYNAAAVLEIYEVPSEDKL